MGYKEAVQVENQVIILDKHVYASNSLEQIHAMCGWYRSAKKRKSVKDATMFHIEQEVRGCVAERLFHLQTYWKQFGFLDQKFDNDSALDMIMKHAKIQLIADDEENNSNEDEEFI